MDLHLARRVEADRLFIDQHGPDASIEHLDGAWYIDPKGRVGIRPQTEQPTLI